MDIELKSPNELSTELFDDIFNLILTGGEVNENTLRAGLKRAAQIAFILEEKNLICTATIKNPLTSYKKRIFTEAKISSKAEYYDLELGYIVTRKGCEGRKLCQKLLSVLMSHFGTHNIFATTRKPEMKHILRKYGFVDLGEIYKQNLQIMAASQYENSKC